jgi:hypothetical protein
VATINQNGTAQIRDNFTEQELKSGSWNAPDSWELSDATLDALQYLRQWSGEPIVVTSTLRTPVHNASVGASSTSQHLTGNAIDFKWADPQVHDEMVGRLRQGIVCSGEVDGIVWSNLYERLGGKGGGFGWYETFLHIDDRGEQGDDTIMWDLSNNKYDQFNMDTQFNREALTDVDYCGGAPQEGKKKPGLLRVLESIFGGGKYSEDGALSFMDRLITYLMVLVLGITATIIYKKTKK